MRAKKLGWHCRTFVGIAALTNGRKATILSIGSSKHSGTLSVKRLDQLISNRYTTTCLKSCLRNGLLFAASTSIFIFSPSSMNAGQSAPSPPSSSAAAPPVIVQPGAPGQPSKTLPRSTRASLPPRSQADVEFMRGMIMHHSQAIEMTALIVSRTENKGLRSLGARISSSQLDEIQFMQRWLATRGEPISMASQDTANMQSMPDMKSSPGKVELMPGMLTAEEMDALRKAKGADFDRLFLTGMIQHHNGALTMVKDLFDTAGAGQDAEMFDFATDADNSQRAEIRIMQDMLEKQFPEEKR
jgi:uncharacterized protein (DUF305 family)